jgi:uncharacterized protein
MTTRFTRLSNLNGVTSSLADSPCIGICSTTQWGDDRCSGCGRTYSEVRDWHTLPEVEKKLINIRNASEKYNIRQLKVRNCVKRTETPPKEL